MSISGDVKKMPRLSYKEAIVIFAAFLVIGTMVAVGIFLYVKNHHNEYDEGGAHKTIKIVNTSSHPSTISTGRKGFPLSPGETKDVNIAQHDTILAKTFFYDGTSLRESKQISNPVVHTLYITDSGLRTNVSGNQFVTFVNLADYPVTLVERGRGGRRWEKCTLPAHGTTKGNFVGKNTTWEVVKPMDGLENFPISEITVGGIPRQLIFDGNTLYSS